MQRDYQYSESRLRFLHHVHHTGENNRYAARIGLAKEHEVFID